VLTSHKLAARLREGVEDATDDDEERPDIDDLLAAELGAKEVGDKGDDEGWEEDTGGDYAEVGPGRPAKVPVAQLQHRWSLRLPSRNGLETGQ
jgi:hypothetical protein